MNSVTFDEYLTGWLRDKENAQAYLGVILEEYARDQDLKILLRSLHYISLAQGDILPLLMHSKNAEIDTSFFGKLKAGWGGMGVFVETLGFNLAALSVEQLPV